ncbi:hypothetical protein BDZ91DRAFT_718431, partial [Kalaharituber pfeilii]
RILQRPGKAIRVIINHGCCSNELFVAGVAGKVRLSNRTLRYVFSRPFSITRDSYSCKPSTWAATNSYSIEPICSILQALRTQLNEQEKLHLARLCVQNQVEHQPGQKGKMKLEKMQESYACLKEPML